MKVITENKLSKNKLHFEKKRRNFKLKTSRHPFIRSDPDRCFVFRRYTMCTSAMWTTATADAGDDDNDSKGMRLLSLTDNPLQMRWNV